jgi:hypothetical protein
MKYLVMMPNSWGTGDTIDEADKVARHQGGHGKKKTKRILWMYDPNLTTKCYIDEMGSLCWVGDRPTEVERT